MLARWVTHKLETSNIKEILPLFWRFWTTCQASYPGDLTNGLGIPRESDFEGQRDLITRLPQDWGKENLQSWWAQTKPYTHQDSEERSSDLTGGWAKTTCWCWGVSCRGVGRQGLTTGWGHWQQRSGKVPPWCKPSSRSPLTQPGSWVTSGQKTPREGVQPHQSADND